MGIVEAAESGDRKATLEALRARLAAEIEVCSARDLASLARQLTLVLDALAEDAPSEGGSFLDELDRRRKDRGSEASAS